MKYPVKLLDMGGEFMLTCPDLPELTGVGETIEDALQEAVDGIQTTLQTYISDRRDIPAPSARKRGQYLITLPPLAVAKVGLYEAMRNRGMRKADLARKLDLHMPQIDRLLDLRHSSKLEHVQGALEALGYRIELTVEAA